MSRPDVVSRTTPPSSHTQDAAIDGRSATTGGSIHTQWEVCQAFARAHGDGVPEDDMCLDEGCSGMRLERPGLPRLRALIRTGAIDAVIVADLARLSRTVSHQRLLAEECNDAGVTVQVVQSPGMPAMDDLRCLMHDTGINGGREEPCDDPTA